MVQVDQVESQEVQSPKYEDIGPVQIIKVSSESLGAKRLRKRVINVEYSSVTIGIEEVRKILELIENWIDVHIPITPSTRLERMLTLATGTFLRSHATRWVVIRRKSTENVSITVDFDDYDPPIIVSVTFSFSLSGDSVSLSGDSVNIEVTLNGKKPARYIANRKDVLKPIDVFALKLVYIVLRTILKLLIANAVKGGRGLILRIKDINGFNENYIIRTRWNPDLLNEYNEIRNEPQQSQPQVEQQQQSQQQPQ